MLHKNNLGFSSAVSIMGFGGLPIMTRMPEKQYLSQLAVSDENTNYLNAINTIRRAIELGINFFDTASDYGDSEEKIGKAIHGIRSEVILASKSKALTYDDMMFSVEKSLKRLNTDYLDLYQLHYVKDKNSYNQIMDKKGAYEALEELKRQGIIKKIGIASHNRYVLLEALEEKVFDTVQLPYNIIESENIDIIKAAQKLGVPTIIMKPFAGGSLTKIKNKLLYLINDDSELRKIAIKFILEQDVSVIIPGITSVKELEENYEIFNNSFGLSYEELDIIKIMKEKIGQTFCRRCQYCEPCPNGIQIAEILRLFKYYCDYELENWAKKQYRELRVKADACVQCKLCEDKCPYKLKIVDELEKINLVLGGNDNA